MLFHVEGQGSRPTFFEMVAAQQLPISLRSALTYSLGVFALRRPFLHKVLDYEDESFALLMLILETHSLRTTDASFSESLYGLRRRVVESRMKDDINIHFNENSHSFGLTKSHKALTVLFLVILPYLKTKLNSIYNKEREASLQANLWGEFDESGFINGGETSLVYSMGVDAEESNGPGFTKRIRKTISACYPWLHSGCEGLTFTYQLLYLLDATRFFSFGLHVLGIHVSRATGQEVMDASSRIEKIRSREREALCGPPWFRAVQGALLTSAYTVLDYAQTGLVAAVFFFKMMEWWYQSAEAKLKGPTIFPPPPPPPQPKAAARGIFLPEDTAVCPLCLQNRSNPSTLTVSGFVFCYSCILKYVSQHKKCPVTLIPADVDHIRRLFQDI